MYKEDLTLNNLQWLICQNKNNQAKPKMISFSSNYFCQIIIICLHTVIIVIIIILSKQL